MFIKFTGEVFEIFWRPKASWYGVLYQGVGRILLMFYVSTFRCRFVAFVCILLQVMATNVMGPALLTKAFWCVLFKRVENWLKNGIRIFTYGSLLPTFNDEFWEFSIRSNIDITQQTCMVHFLRRTHGWDPDSIGIFLQNWPTDVDRKFVVKPETGVVPTATSCFKGRAK